MSSTIGFKVFNSNNSIRGSIYDIIEKSCEQTPTGKVAKKQFSQPIYDTDLH